MAHPIPKLYLITNEQDCPDTSTLLIKVEACLKVGIDWVQYRVKDTAHAIQLEQAQLLKQLCDDYQAELFINDSVDLALTVDAHLHLGQQDSHLSSARQLLGTEKKIGLTCHNQVTLALEAEKLGADYVSFGAFFPSITKPHANLCDWSVLEAASQVMTLPIVVIGGISEKNIAKFYEESTEVSRIAISHHLLKHRQKEIEHYFQI